MTQLFNEYPFIIAHRGYSSRYPENTMIAFIAAFENNANGIELDVTLSRDNQYMVIHDERLERTTDGTGWVKNANLRQLQLLDAGSWFAPYFSHSGIPTLNQVLEQLGNKLLINIEIKNQPFEKKQANTQGLLNIIHKYNLSSSVLVSSFDHSCALELESIPFGLLYDSLPNPSEVLDAVRTYKACSVHPSTRELSASWVKEVAAHKIPILPWTVNDPAEAQQLIDWGSYGIFTDQPTEMRRVLHKVVSKPRKKPVRMNQPNQ